jgi:hypothetical protein
MLPHSVLVSLIRRPRVPAETRRGYARDENDENMIAIRGNTRVADIYLGEFMRLYSHHAFREFVNQRGTPELNHLLTDDWWEGHFGDSSQSRRRIYFSGAPQ